MSAWRLILGSVAVVALGAVLGGIAGYITGGGYAVSATVGFVAGWTLAPAALYFAEKRQ